MRTITYDQMLAGLGQEMGLSRWFTMDQARIDAFAEVSEDRQYIHVDPARAAKTAFGGTIVHGMLTLSMISAMAQDVSLVVEGQSEALNYGFEKVQFVAPVHVGARIRGRFVVADVQMRARDMLMCTFDVVVEVEGEARAGVKAKWSVLYVF